jgi:glycerol-3-phosphate cytidylyltransferase
MHPWEIASLTDLKPHKGTDPARVAEVQQDLLCTDLMQTAVTVDRRTRVIIKGHHRCQAILALGFKKIPVWYVDYLEDEQLAFSESSAVQDKTRVLAAGISGRLLPARSTQHLAHNDALGFIEPPCLVPLDRLKTRVVTVGVFDLFHLGHVNLLKAAKSLGHHLIVGVQYNVERYKQARIFYSFEQRIDIIRSLRYVDLAVPYENVDEKLHEIDFDIFARGPDQNHAGFQRAIRYCADCGREVVTLPRTEHISASALRKGLTDVTILKAPPASLVA